MLRILHLEDCPDDAFFVEQALKEGGINASFKVVKDRPNFVQALYDDRFDLILSDNGLPGFSSVEALKLAREKRADVGFICISGSDRDEHALDCLNAGATNYVQKDRLWELIAAVRAEQERIQLKRMNSGMARLVAAVQELSLARALETIMAIVRRAAREITGADGATFVLRDGDLCHYADEDAIAPLWKGKRFPLKACISGWAMLNRQSAVIEDIYADDRIPADAYRPTFVKSLAMVPIRTSAPIGAIGNYWATRRMPTREEVELLQALANTTAVAMENVQVYQELEQRVKDRTVELQLANEELESFSHAVSHDLRAPLRSIQGFANMLQQESKATLSETGQHYLSRILLNSKTMSGLIDDLLRLSKVTRASLKKSRTNLSARATEILEQLASAAPERRVELRVEAGLEAEVDPGLIRIALENLLSNAWKYTVKRDGARIEFLKVQQPDGSVAFCIRDNGAGFDMAFVDKLFQPFQRLHSPNEFPGTGIGLTTVQRIIQRHSGRIWAQAQPDKGAEFFFTLP